MVLHLILGEIAVAQAISPIATQFSTASSVVCHIRALNRRICMPFGMYTCGSNDSLS